MPIDPKHFIDLVDGRFHQTSPADLRALFGDAAASDHLVVHFHGGLVSRESAMNTAAAMTSAYTAGNAYPVFFLWNSDLPSLVKGSWDEIPTEPAFNRLVRRLLQMAIAKVGPDGARGGALTAISMRDIPTDLNLAADFARRKEPENRSAVTELSDAERRDVERELNLDTDLRLAAAEIALYEQQRQGLPVESARGGVPDRPRRSRMSAGVRENIRRDFFATPGEPAPRGGLLWLAKAGAQILFQVIKRYATHRDHGLYTTIVEETMREIYVDSLGQLAWEMMKHDTLDAFGHDADCGGTAFLSHLKEWWRPGRRVTLVGHSTGAVYIGNFLVAADAALPAECQFTTVFLAAAISFEDMYARLPVFRKRVGDHIRAFGLKDEREHGYFEVPVLYDASLLYMVSGLFEMSEVDKEIVGMQRYHDRTDVYDDDDVNTVRQYLAGKVYWAECTTPDGCLTSSERHGGFSADPKTLGSLTHILRNGLA